MVQTMATAITHCFMKSHETSNTTFCLSWYFETGREDAVVDHVSVCNLKMTKSTTFFIHCDMTRTTEPVNSPVKLLQRSGH